MSKRRSIYAIVRRETPNGGVSPNAYFPEVTAEVRLHYPPLATLEECLAVLHEAFADAHDQLMDEHRAAEAARALYEARKVPPVPPVGHMPRSGPMTTTGDQVVG